MTNKKFITTTIVFALVLVGSIGFLQSLTGASDFVRPPATAGQIRIGNKESDLEIIVIEDMLCKGCQNFSLNVFPIIKQKYIDVNRATCILIPISFIRGSNLLSNAALFVNEFTPDRFLPFFHELIEFFSQNPAGDFAIDDILEIAENVGKIDLDKLRESIETERYSQFLNENMEWAKKILGNNFKVPAIFVDQSKVSNSSLKQIQSVMEKRK